MHHHFFCYLTDRPRPQQQTYRGTSSTFTLPSALPTALKALSQHEGATLFMTLLAAFQILLSRYTGQEDIVVGAPIAGRTHIEVEGLIGFFVNTLVLRTDMSNNPTFRELLGRIRETALNAYAHQEVPCEKLVDELQPQRHLSYAPLIQVLFTLQNVPPAALPLVGVRSSNITLEGKNAKFDLTLVIWEDEDGLRGEVEYNTDLFDSTTIVRLVGHYQTLLEGIVTNPEVRIGDLPLLTEGEWAQQSGEWNAAQTEFRPQRCVHELIEAQVERTPEAIAVVYAGQQLTYRDLNSRANVLAQQLQQRGAGPNGLVGLWVERSLEVVIGILGILKSGAAFVPLDPEVPPERVAFTVQDAELGVVVAPERLRSLLTVASGCQVVGLEPVASGAVPVVANGGSAVTPEDLAYVIYTSGSTGKPKGTLIEHQAIARHCEDIRAYYELRATDRVLQFSSLSFDTALEQILPPLMSGATVVLRDATLWAADEVLPRLAELGVTVVDLPTAYWRQVVQLLGQMSYGGGLPRLVIAGGEAMVPEDLVLWKASPLRAVRLLNAYGPTEATITATICELTPLLMREQLPPRVPIGRPLGNRRAFILDRTRTPVPIGVLGELYLGGAGLARGYLNRPELTAERFIEHAFAGEPPQRLYRTGDLGRYRPDGSIEFWGRSDQQVKIRGFRVELGEIEAVVCQHPAVREAVVVVREDEAEGARVLASPSLRVVAYVVVAAGTAPGEIREFLRQRLPEFMIPAAVVSLAALPVTASGKIDRKALPAPDSQSLSSGTSYVEPRGLVEERVARIWAEALQVEKVGVHDNFFELGGHSLLLVQVHRRLRAELKHSLSVVDLFKHPTIAALGRFLREEQETAVAVSQLEQRAHRRRTSLARRKKLAPDLHEH